MIGKNKIILAGGGTGGHLYPGMAIAQEFQKQGAEVLFVVTCRDMDQKIMSGQGFQYVSLPVESFRGISLHTIWALGCLSWSIIRALGLVRSFRPSLIIGLGAYPSVPMMLAGKLSKIPLAIQEQNLWPGQANKIMAKLADRIFISFPETTKFFHAVPEKKIVLTGNPVRRQKLSTPKEMFLEKGKFTLLIFGGSKGARRINEVMMDALANLPKKTTEKLQIIHQTGQEDFERVNKFYQQVAIKSIVLPFIHQMIEAYHAADLVICRAGATTIAEITLMGKAAIMIPYPYAVGDHQTTNARVLQKAGAGILIPERDLSRENLWAAIQSLIDHPQDLMRMQKESKKFGEPAAATKIVQECLNLIKGAEKIKGNRLLCF